MTIQEMKKIFLEKFGGEDKGIRVFASPGRVNLIGEHTDYNGGYVFPAALSMKTTIIARPRNDRTIRMMATDLGEMVTGSLDTIDDYKGIKWGDYQFGVAKELMGWGYNVIGADMLYHDTTPHGGGLSSSAAIEVATAIALAKIGGKDEVDNIEMAKISQKAEHNYIGVKCGIMDQFASAMGKKNHAILLDCKDISYKLVPLKIDGYKLVISNTNKKRSLADSKYNERCEECAEGLAALNGAMPDKKCLGEISIEEFNTYKHLIDDSTVLKRVTHVIEEDNRVLESVKALESEDMVYFGKLMNASHDSLRDLYEVTGIELDTLVEQARLVEGVLGSRMTGAGFGGCTVSIVKQDAVKEFEEKVGKAYTEKIGYAPSFYISEIGDGGQEIL